MRITEALADSNKRF